MYFQMSEFKCKCGCGEGRVHPTLVAMLQRAREIAGIPMKVNRGCSCPEHNKKVGGSDTSSHLVKDDWFCLAADIKTANSVHRWKIIDAAIKAGFTRIGIGKNFVHLDIDQGKPAGVIWDYYDIEGG